MSQKKLKKLADSSKTHFDAIVVGASMPGLGKHFVERLKP